MVKHLPHLLIPVFIATWRRNPPRVVSQDIAAVVATNGPYARRVYPPATIVPVALLQSTATQDVSGTVARIRSLVIIKAACQWSMVMWRSSATILWATVTIYYSPANTVSPSMVWPNSPDPSLQPTLRLFHSLAWLRWVGNPFFQRFPTKFRITRLLAVQSPRKWQAPWYPVGNTSLSPASRITPHAAHGRLYWPPAPRPFSWVSDFWHGAYTSLSSAASQISLITLKTNNWIHHDCLLLIPSWHRLWWVPLIIIPTTTTIQDVFQPGVWWYI